MILRLGDGEEIRGDLIRSAVVRSDMSPIPITLEAEIRADNEMQEKLGEGESIFIDGMTDGNDESEVVRIVKSEKSINRLVQGRREMDAVRITALLEPCQPISFVRSRAIIKENVPLSAIYRAAGASIKAIDADFPVSRFTCLVGDTASFHIARVLQEEGGIVRWKSGRLRFFRLGDLFRQDIALNLPENASDDIGSDFIERHEIPWFFSVEDDGSFVLGNRQNPRSVRFSPFKNAQQLTNMSRCLVHRKTSKITLTPNLSAGDLVNFVGDEPLCVVTAAHAFFSGTDGSGSNQYTKLWLSSLEEPNA